MKITPIEIRQKTFDKSFRGYNIDEVDAFLHILSIAWQENNDMIEKLIKEIKDLKKETTRLKKIEDSLCKNIDFLENNSDKILKNAEESAIILIEKAKMEALKIRENKTKNSDELNKINKNLKIILEKLEK